MQYFWLKYDLTQYKGPNDTGKVILAHDIVEEGFTFDPTSIDFEFFFDSSDDRELGDFAFWRQSVLFMNLRAYSALQHLMDPNGRVYEISCNIPNYFIATIDTVVDGFDYQNSEFKYKNKADWMNQDGSYIAIGDMYRISLNKNILEYQDVFRLQGNVTIGTKIIVSEKFKYIYEENKFTGLLFSRCI